MAQTTGAATLRNAKIEFSTNASDWVDISGVTNKIDPSGYAVKSGEVWTADGDDPIIGVGKNEPLEVDVTVVYTENSTEGYLYMHGYKVNKTAIKLRWAPKGGTTGSYRYTTGTGYVIECLPPGGDVDSGDPILGAFKVKAPGYVAAAIS